jgi:hypothetical protein
MGVEIQVNYSWPRHKLEKSDQFQAPATLSQYRLDSKLVWPQKRFKLSGKENNLFCPCPFCTVELFLTSAQVVGE